MEGNHAIKFYLIAKCFKNDENQLRRGENAYTSGHVKKMLFDSDMQPAYLQGEVQASMKKRNYKVEVYIDLGYGIVSSKCSCPRGQALCHHIAALLYYAHYNISSTDKVREWGLTKSVKEGGAGTSTIDKLYPRQDYTALAEDTIDECKIEEFRKRLGKTNVVGFSWLLKPEAEKYISAVVVPIDEMLFSEEYMNAEDKGEYLCHKCYLDSEQIKEIAAVTIEQSKNDGWLVSRKMRLTASKFGVVISATQRNKFPPSLFKSLMEGYDLNRVLAVQWGKDNEETAIQKFSEATNLKVTPTGLWLHECGFLGASPDGLIGEEEIVEVKCPYKFRNLSIKNGVADKKYFFYYEDNEKVVNRNHIYYHQIQGQLYLTNRNKCYFFVWTPNEHEIVIIMKDPEWFVNIQILKDFYLNKFVPAIFDLK